MNVPAANKVPGGPRGVGDVLAFVTAVVFPLVSAGILVIEILRLFPDLIVGTDAVMSVGLRRLVGSTLAGLGVAACAALALDRTAPRRERRFHLIFLAVNVLVAAGWLLFWHTTA